MPSFLRLGSEPHEADFEWLEGATDVYVMLQQKPVYDTDSNGRRRDVIGYDNEAGEYVISDVQPVLVYAMDGKGLYKFPAATYVLTHLFSRVSKSVSIETVVGRWLGLTKPELDLQLEEDLEATAATA